MRQPFDSLDRFVRHHRLVLPAPRDTWRLVRDPLVGQINGIDHIRGGAIATNGILVALLNEHDRVQFGHLAWFVPDKDEHNAEMSDLWDGAPHLHKSLKAVEDYTTW